MTDETVELRRENLRLRRALEIARMHVPFSHCDTVRINEIFHGEDRTTTPVNAELVERLKKTARSFRNADTEFRRAQNAGEQPRLSNAGTRYACAKFAMFKALSALEAIGGKHD